METFKSFVAFVVFVIILGVIVKSAFKALNNGPIKMGSGKKAKGVGSIAEQVTIDIIRGVGRGIWKIATAPFRRPSP